MNKLILILSFCSLPFILLSQETPVEIETPEVVKIAKHEFGLNATQFFKRLISFNELPIDDPNAYLLTYKVLLNHKNSLRFGLNANFDNSQQEAVVSGNESDELKSYNFDLRFGYLVNRRLTNRWSAYLGLDLLYSSGHSETTFVNVFEPILLTRETSTLGGGPAIGIQFFINSKISLSTELTLYYKYIETQDEQDFDSNGFADVVINNKRSAASLATPASLYFNFRF